MSRQEIELVVDDFERAKQFIEALGYEVWVFYEKYRTTYELNVFHIMLDELPYGDFVEIEGENISSIHEIAIKLGLKWETAITASYHALFERVAKTRGLDKNQLTFAAFGETKPSAEELSIARAD